MVLFIKEARLGSLLSWALFVRLSGQRQLQGAGAGAGAGPGAGPGAGAGAQLLLLPGSYTVHLCCFSCCKEERLRSTVLNS